MALIEIINTDLLDATKGNEPLIRDTLRMAKTAIKNTEINKGHELSDEEILEVLTKEVKQRTEAAAAFTTGDRPELAAKEQAEIVILQKYLPAQMTEEEVTTIVEQTIAEVRASSIAEIGKVMGALMPKVKGKADGNMVNQIVRSKLS
jgi:uncharacterized protein YqeY